jgi:hypothetical protein
MMQKFMGRDSFVWWHGVVEDIADPLYLGRCRVRIFGFHSDDLTKLPTSSLPWAYPMQPITSAAVSGIGQSPTGLLNGSHVFGFFRDGEEAQDPVIIGSFGGIPQNSSNKTKGFNDPDGKYPATAYEVAAKTVPSGVSVVNEADTNRLARNNDQTQMKSTIAAQKASTVKTGIKSNPSMSVGQQWSEPATPYAAQYPKNHVRFTESGHAEEFDDTPGHERISQYHNSGSFTEVGNGWASHPNGTRVQRIVGDDFEIVYGNKNIYVAGGRGMNLVVDGKMSITINSDANIQINGDANVLASKDVNLQVDGNIKASAARNIEFHAGSDFAVSATTISLSTLGSVFVMRPFPRIEANSGLPAVRPSTVNLKGSIF